MKYIINIDCDFEIDEENCIVISNEFGKVNVIVNDISEIYPNIKDEFKNKVNKQIDMYNEYVADTPEEAEKNRRKILEILGKLNDRVISKNTDNEKIVLYNYTKSTIDNLKEYYPNTCLIDIMDMDEHEKIRLLTENNFPNNMKFIDKYTKYDTLDGKELLNMYKTIYEITKKIEGYNFTPLEKVIYIYDEVRKKPYKNNEKRLGASRNLNEILSNNDIVCEGYANIIEAICTSLDIKCEKIYWEPKEGNIGHASNLVYINDEYYDVHGFYSIDATATNSGNYDNYLERYDTFLIPLDSITKTYDKIHKYNRVLNNEDLIRNSYKRINKLVQMNAPQIVIDESIEYLIKKIKNTYEVIGDNDKAKYCEEKQNTNIVDFEVCEDIYKSYEKLFSDDPDDISLIQAIYRVKRIEYLENPLENKLDVEMLKKTYNTLLPVRKNINFFAIFGVDNFNSYIENAAEIDELSNIDAKSSNERITKDIQRLTVLNTLKNELNRKMEVEKTYRKK